MKKLFLFAVIMTFVACGEDVNKCPVGAYGTHAWSMDSYGSSYYIEKCNYCSRHRRVYHDSTKPYDYEDMKDGSLSIQVPR